ncbi:type II toxin-antitoxin system ParD family antitoxin [Candidatus Accumulibacter sp. ACC003]|uniref:type II toxin-antitoxin system ParD family antitoxin n=1 Tax=Candidatus Accumulibacter sp. ACC003 TaxID=2823334 RepID=UPI0025BE0A97|nr:type II toxin-antitoxin system ParD family antitoxin [Candidatus Accumulibacter sp. ACC003]
MPRNTSVTLGEHCEGFIAQQIDAGRFESKSEVVRAAMRLLEEHEQRVSALRQALVEGETSGEPAPFAMASIAAEARREAKNGSVGGCPQEFWRRR